MDKQKIQHYGDELYQALIDRKPVCHENLLMVFPMFKYIP